MLGMFTTDSMSTIRKLYTKLYPNEMSDQSESEIPHSFRKYSAVSWHGK